MGARTRPAHSTTRSTSPTSGIEYELHGREQHEDVEVVTEHYRGAHGASVARAGFRCYGRGGGRGGPSLDPRVAEDFL